MKKWFVAAKKADFNAIADQYHISPILARLIRNRDVTGDEAIRKYLYGTLEDLYDPFLLDGMKEAAALLHQAVSDGKKIQIIGDYDVDGICSGYILYAAIRAIGGDVSVAIPHRIHDGYGMNIQMVERAAAEGVELIITCDNGIAAAEQIAFAKQLGMTVIVTDHHEVPFVMEGEEKKYILPPADVVIDPKKPGDTYPFPGICGAVVAFKVAQALAVGEELLDKLLEAAGVATVCDVMELQDENRILVKEALKRINHTKHPGLKALIAVCGLEEGSVEAYHLGFVIGPCLNASGRLESAMMACELWMAKDYGEGVRMASQLKALNESRKQMTEDNVLLAAAQIESWESLPKVVVVFLPDCHESLAGIVAGRIRERYQRPTIVLTRAEQGLKGSGRSVEEYDMFASLTSCRELFTKFGGHKMAAGLSLPEENLEELRRRLNEECTLQEEDFVARLHVDIALPIAYVTDQLMEEIEKLEPFGVGNSKPVFAQKNVPILQATLFGKRKNVFKATVLDENEKRWELVCFSGTEELVALLQERYGADIMDRLSRGRAEKVTLNVGYYPSVNTFRGSRSLQIVMTDFC